MRDVWIVIVIVRGSEGERARESERERVRRCAIGERMRVKAAEKRDRNKDSTLYIFL